MIILEDTREQKPLHFPKRFEGLEGVERTTLKIGDYAVRFKDGTIPPIRIERKSLCDLYGTLGKGYKRFKKEINRAIEQNIMFFLIIEGSLNDVKMGFEYSQRDPESVVKQIFTLFVKHGVFPVFCTGRREMAYWIYSLFYAYGKMKYSAKEKE